MHGHMNVKFLIIVYCYKYTVRVVSSDGNKINNIIMINIKAVKHNDRPPKVFIKTATDSISTLEYGNTRL